MELPFEKTESRFWQQKLYTPVVKEETQEYKLPDTLPDAGRVISAWGQAVLRGKEWSIVLPIHMYMRLAATFLFCVPTIPRTAFSSVSPWSANPVLLRCPMPQRLTPLHFCQKDCCSFSIRPPHLKCRLHRTMISLHCA